MKKYLILLIIPVLFFSTGCEEEEEDIVIQGIVKYEITTESNFFHVRYWNEYGNVITELCETNYWTKDVNIDVVSSNQSLDVYYSVTFDNGEIGNQNSQGDDVLITSSVSFNGNILESFNGISSYETLIGTLPQTN